MRTDTHTIELPKQRENPKKVFDFTLSERIFDASQSMMSQTQKLQVQTV